MDDLRFKKELSPLNAWAFSFGCLLGWGGFVMPATVFLPNGGVLGSLLAFAVGGVFIAIVALNYAFLSRRCPGNGGIFYLLHNTMGRKHAYAAAWGICLAHMVIIPLNARALARLVKALLYEWFGLEFHIAFLNKSIMLVDFIIMLLVLVFFGYVNTKSIRLTGRIQTVLAIILFAGITILFFMALFSGVPIREKMTPALYPGRSGLSSFFTIFILIPWAFVGFDSVPALTRETKFTKKKLAVVMVLAVLAGCFGYMANIVITVLGVPEGFSGWPEYTDAMNSYASLGGAITAGDPFGGFGTSVSALTGLGSIAVVGAARNLFGSFGTVVAVITLLAAILSGPNAAIAMTSRLVYTMSKSNALFPGLSKTNDNGVPYNSIIFTVFVAIIMIIIAGTFNIFEQVASLCTSFGYGYISLSALLQAKKAHDPRHLVTGGVGVGVCLIWFILLLIPMAFTGLELSLGTYLSLAAWIFVGICGYAYTCRKPDYLFED